MSFIQKVKIILQLVLMCSLFLLNAAVYQKYNYFAPAKHLAFIPKTAVLSVTVNANRLSGQLLYNFLYKNDEIIALLDDVGTDDGSRGKLLNSGLDVSSQLTFFMTNNTSAGHFKYAGLLVDITSPENAQAHLTANGYKAITGGMYKKSNREYAVTNDEVLAIVLFKDSAYAETEKQAALATLAAGKDGGEIGNRVAPYLDKGNDAVIYGLPENLSDKPMWMRDFMVYGRFDGDAFTFDMDFNFTNDVSALFPTHTVKKDFDFNQLNGYLYMKSVFDAPDAQRIWDKLTFLKASDSLQNLLEPVLEGQRARGVELYCHDLNKAKFNVQENPSFEMKFLSGNFYLPAFDFKLVCSNPNRIDTVFARLQQEGKLQRRDNNWYLWQRDEFYQLYFGIKNDWLNITTKPNNQDHFPETGFTNVFYFNADKLNEKWPDLATRFMADQFRIFEYFLAYTTKVDKNKLYASGKMVFTTGNNSLMEVLKTLVKFKELDMAVLLSGAS